MKAKISGDRKNLKRAVALALLAGLLLSAYYGIGFVRSLVRIQATRLEPGASDPEAVRGWMTVPYIARAFRLQPGELYRLAGLPEAGSEGKSLQALNKEYFPDRRAFVVERVREAVRLALAGRIQPAGPAP